MAFNLVITSGKGGVGKSMLSSTLSFYFAKTKKIVALDADVDAPNLSIWLGETQKPKKITPIKAAQRPVFNSKKNINWQECAQHCPFGAIEIKNGKPHLNTFLCEGCGVCERACPEGAVKMHPVQNGWIKIKKTKYGFWLIEGELIPGESGSGKIVDELKSVVREFESDLTIIDSAPGTACPVISALKDADFAVLITEPSPSGISDLKRVLRNITYFRIPWGLVINKWNIAPKKSSQIKRYFKENFLGQISYDKSVISNIANLVPVFKTKSPVKKEIEKIFLSLKTRLKL